MANQIMKKDEFIESLKALKKQELIDLCNAGNISFAASDTKAVLTEKLIAAFPDEEGNEEAVEKPEKKAAKKPAPKKNKAKPAPGTRAAEAEKMREERSKNVRNINAAMNESSENAGITAKGTGEDMDLSPRQIRNAPDSLSIEGGRATSMTPEMEEDFALTESFNNPAVIHKGEFIFAIENRNPWENKPHPETGKMMRFYQIAAVIEYGTKFVYIPAEYFLEDYYNLNQEKMRSYIEERAGSEVEFRVINISREDPENPIYIGSRIAAMKKNRCDFWYSERTKGRSLLEPDSIHEAKVVAVSKTQLFVELFGVETRINARDVTWNYVEDLRDIYAPGFTEMVKVKSAALADRRRADSLGFPVKCELSVKEAKPDPRDRFFKTNLSGIRFSGVVRHTRTDDNNINWYYVEMGGSETQEGMTIMCRLGDKVSKIPRRGDRVGGKVTFPNDKQKRIFGTIYHVDPPARQQYRR